MTAAHSRSKAFRLPRSKQWPINPIMRRRISACILAIVLCGCGPHSRLMTQFGEMSVRGTHWTLRISESDRELHIIRHIGPGTGDSSVGGWKAKQGWFAFVENDKRVWGYDGETGLFALIVMPDDQGGTGVYGPGNFPCPVPNEVLARLSPDARQAIQDHRKQL